MHRSLLALAILVAATPAHAHTGGHVGGFASGFGHPFLGLDHLLAMVAVGIWAGQAGGRSLWIVPAAFVAAMAAGGALAVAGIGLPLVEAGILASVVLLGLLIAAAVRLPLPAAAAIAALFALFHGQAHGAEMPAAASPLLYGLGFLGATALLHALGVTAAGTVRERGMRLAGVGILSAGALMMAGF